MNNFLKNLLNTDDSLLKKRAESVNSRAKMTQENLISKIKLEIEEKKLKYEELIDLGPTDSNSLSPASSNWNPTTWVNQIQNIKMDIHDLTIQLKMALETYQNLFTDQEKEEQKG